MKDFRRLSSLTVMGMLVFLAACGDNETETNGNNEGNAEASTNSANDNEAQGEEVSIRFAHSAVEANPRHEAIVEFKDLVEERSNGEISVEVFANEALGSEPQMVESVEFNELEMVASSTFSQYEPKMDVFSLPFLFESNEKAWEVLDGPIGEEVAEPLLDNNLRILSHMENGMRHITNDSRPIESVEDLEGLSVRVPEIPILLSTFEALGANVTPMAFGELYMALQQGTVDGQENPITNVHATNFYEVQDYLSLTNHTYLATTIGISDEFWQELSPEHQEIIEESAVEIADLHRQLVTEEEQELLEELEGFGMEVNTPDSEEFREATQEVYAEYEETFGQDLIDRVVEAAQE